MQKKWLAGFPDRESQKKLGKIMKLIILFFFGFMMTVSANSYSQKTKMDVNLSNTTIKGLFEYIEQNSEFVFLYRSEDFNTAKKVDIELKEATVYQILDLALKGESVAYDVYERQIVIRKAAEPANGQQQQKKEISGTVKDGNRVSVPGASVVVKGTTIGIITDTDGKFTLQVPVEAKKLSITFIGMKSQEIDITAKTTINVILEEDAIGIEEVIAVGYGVQKKVNLTGAVSTVNMEELKNRPITNSSQALQGVSGLYVNQAGGQPGKDNATIRVRGQGTLNDNNPLVLVDGIEFPLADVNPNDIESISVLKDAASASIYGNRAANGVILVTTKKGVQGVSKIEYSNNIGVQQPTYLPDMIKDPIEFMVQRNQAQRNSGKLIVDFDDALINEYRQGMLTDPKIYPANDWLKIMFKNAVMQEHNFRFSGSNEKVNYNLSVGYQDQKGVLMGTNSNQFSIRSNVNIQLNNWIKVGSDFSATYRFVHEPATSAGDMMQMVFKAQGFHPTYLDDGRYANVWVRTPGHNNYRHPLVWANETYLNNKTTRGLMSIYADLKLPFGINYYAKAAANKLDGLQAQFVPEIYMYQLKTLAATKVDYNMPTANNRHVTNQDDENLNLTFFNTLSWNGSIAEKHNLKVMLGSSYESFTSRYFSATIEGFLGNKLYELSAGSTNPINLGTSSANFLIGGFGRVNYDFSQKYLFEANFRYDGSSRFAKGNRWGFFPSFSAGWRMNQEDFMKDLTWISGLKLRASYGSLGNEQIGNFRYVNLMDSGQSYLFSGLINPGVAVTKYNDPNITWETTTIGNLGFDASLFKNTLNISLEGYDKRTTNVLRQVNIPGQVGNLGGPVMNIGTVDNKGYELNISYQNKIKDFSYKMDFGLNYNINKILDLKGQIIYNDKFITKENYPIDSYFLLHAIGIFQTAEEIKASPFQNITTKPGYLKYQDQNGDNVINQDDRIITGNVIPKYTYDFTINLAYKNWSVTGFFQGVQGINTYPRGVVAVPFWFGTAVTKEWLTDSWTPQRTDARLPIMTTWEDCQYDNYQLSDFWLKDASFLRFKNLQVAYTVPKSLISKLGLKNLLLFVNGQNMFTLSKMKDFDPEKNIKGDNYYEYPSVKTYSFGINVSF